jgi:hypothetical protein
MADELRKIRDAELPARLLGLLFVVFGLVFGFFANIT